MHFLTKDSKRIILSLVYDSLMKNNSNAVGHGSEIMLVLNGSASIAVNDTTVSATEGDVVFFENIINRRISSFNGSFSTISVIFDTSAFINDDFRIFGKQDLDQFYANIRNMDVRIPGDSRTASKIKNILFDIEEEFELDIKSPNEFMIKALLLSALAYIIRHFSEHGETQNINKLPHYADISKTMVYINENIASDISLDELAKIANMSKYYYSTMFKKITGLTVWEYVLNTRIELAISYLTKDNTNYSITEILGMCGFNNASAFNKSFKKITGKTPTEFKNSKHNSCF